MGLASGQKTPYAICRWAHWHKEELLELLQPTYRHIPCASTFYRILQWRGQWTIENRSHYVRDETMGEDRGQIARGNGPQAPAALRNAVLTALQSRGWESIAEALRYHDASVGHSFHLTTPLAAPPLQDQPTFRRL
ncbi:MAG: hypothetical protein H5T69_08080 [Chloroflexi bacterium]|nr:hypothetical protein [Chloroflexota bacterium]